MSKHYDKFQTARFWKWYRQYLATPEWQWVREQVIKRDKCCLHCQKPYNPNGGFDVHHQHYRYVGWSDINEVESCVLLCSYHHKLTHGHIQKQNIPTDMTVVEIDNEQWFADLEAGREFRRMNFKPQKPPEQTLMQKTDSYLDNFMRDFRGQG